MAWPGIPLARTTRLPPSGRIETVDGPRSDRAASNRAVAADAVAPMAPPTIQARRFIFMGDLLVAGSVPDGSRPCNGVKGNWTAEARRTRREGEKYGVFDFPRSFSVSSAPLRFNLAFQPRLTVGAGRRTIRRSHLRGNSPRPTSVLPKGQPTTRRLRWRFSRNFRGCCIGPVPMVEGPGGRAGRAGRRGVRGDAVCRGSGQALRLRRHDGLLGAGPDDR